MPKAVEETFIQIRDMKVRGAGRIARLAAEALKQFAMESQASSAREFIESLAEAGEYLHSSRPTAVSLPNCINYVLSRARRAVEEGVSVSDLRARTVEAAEEFVRQSLEAVEKISELGVRRIAEGDVILTHCNSEAALRIILKAHRMGKGISVFVTESRPRYQGRISANILAKEGVPTTLIVDGAARLFMRKIDKMVVGADAIAANGAVVNKIGTAQLALTAHEARTRVFVAAETYKFSPQTFLGELVEIEERSPGELVPEKWLGENASVNIRNPAFDVTPPAYIDLIITERGVFPPQAAVMLIRELYPA